MRRSPLYERKRDEPSREGSSLCRGPEAVMFRNAEEAYTSGGSRCGSVGLKLLCRPRGLGPIPPLRQKSN